MNKQLDIFNRSIIKMLNVIKKGYYSKIGRGTKDFKILQAKNNKLEFGNQLNILSKRNPYGGGTTFTIIKITAKNIITLTQVNYFDMVSKDFLGKYHEVMAFDKKEFIHQLNRLN